MPHVVPKMKDAKGMRCMGTGISLLLVQSSPMTLLCSFQQTSRFHREEASQCRRQDEIAARTESIPVLVNNAAGRGQNAAISSGAHGA